MGRIDVDDYTNEQVSSGSILVTRTTTVRCDRCAGEGVWKFKRCELCDGTGRRSITPLDDHRFNDREPRIADLELWGKRGSYHELLAELSALSLLDVAAYRLVMRVLVYRSPLEVETMSTLAAAVTWLAYRMPLVIEVPPGVAAAEKRLREHGTGVRGRWANNGALKKRDADIRRHSREGRSQQWIAREYGLTPARVSQLLKVGRASADVSDR